jgi:hypothetical protein
MARRRRDGDRGEELRPLKAESVDQTGYRVDARPAASAWTTIGPDRFAL